jgi:hypothetical protein
VELLLLLLLLRAASIAAPMRGAHLAASRHESRDLGAQLRARARRLRESRGALVAAQNSTTTSRASGWTLPQVEGYLARAFEAWLASTRATAASEGRFLCRPTRAVVLVVPPPAEDPSGSRCVARIRGGRG